MHYMNKRPAETGDWIIGPTHSSLNGLVVGVVVEVFTEERGNCNLKLLVPRDRYFTEEGNSVCAFRTSNIEEHYADAKECLHVMDGYKMVKAVLGHGMLESPFSQVRMGLGCGTTKL